MKPLWLLGADIARSPSPAMQNAGLVALGLDPVYALHPCDDVSVALDDAERVCRGINVTAPHKVRTAERYDAVLDDDARAAGAVNTVVFEELADTGGRAAVAALNTDVAGLVHAWRRSNLHVEGRTVAVIGAGGAARAVVVAAHRAKAKAIVVHARRLDAALEIVGVAARLGLDATAAPPDRAEPLDATLAVVAASHLEDEGAWIGRALAGPGAVHDLRYGARARRVRDAALARGHLFADGTLLLLEQGRLALAAFIGAPVSDDATSAMRRALTSSL